MNIKNKNKQSNKTLILIFIVIITLCFVLWYIKVEYRINTTDNKIIASNSGVFDLTTINFNSGIAFTKGSEKYIEGKILTPKEFEEETEEVKIGSPKSSPVNTSKITLIMPDNSPYTIMGISYDYAERIYINGELYGEIGTIATSENEAKPGYEYLKFTVTPQNGIIEIVRQSNNFVHRDNGVATHILIGKPNLMNQIYAKEYGITGVIIGLFFTIAISHIFLFYIFKKHKAHLYFAVLCITWGIRMGVTGTKVFNEWFSFLPWEFMFRLEYMTVPVTCAMILLVSNEIYPSALPKMFLHTFVGGFLLYAVCCLFVPTIPLSYSMIGVQAALIVGSIVLTICVIIKTINLIYKREITIKHTVYLISLLPFVFAAVHDALYYNSILIFGVSVLLIDFALMVIVVTQTAVIYFDTAQRMVATYNSEQQIKIQAESLRRANRMKEEFLRTLSHEMQIPLTTVSGYAQLTGQILKTDKELSREDLHEKMRIIDDETRKLSRQVAYLLDANAMENGTFKLHLTSVDINELLHKIEKLHYPIMNSGDIKLVLKVKGNLLKVFADEERLSQIVLNLIVNSIKHSHCTQIEVSAENIEKSINDNTSGKFVQITVTDNGKGLSKKMKEELFTIYSKNRSGKGNGLGLYIVEQTVKAHGGTIYVKSEEKEGTSTIFTIPALEEVKNEQ